jgi:hypothetical protein
VLEDVTEEGVPSLRGGGRQTGVVTLLSETLPTVSYWPNRRSRCPYARSARMKSTLRKSGHRASQK